jgi:hypothetical protein
MSEHGGHCYIMKSKDKRVKTKGLSGFRLSNFVLPILPKFRVLLYQSPPIRANYISGQARRVQGEKGMGVVHRLNEI